MLLKSEHPLESYENRRKYEKRYLKQFTKQERIFKKIIDLYLREQMLRVVDSMDNQVKGLEDEVFNMELEIQLAKKGLLPYLEEILIQAGAGAMLFAGSDYDFTFSSQIASIIDKRADLFSRSINETTFSQLKDQFTESFEAGENRNQLINRIENTYSGISKKRATTIARTEVSVANQTGIFEGYKQAGVENKIWVTVGDSKVRDSHASIDGEKKPLMMPFSNGLMRPSDPTGSAGETINCRCTI